MKFIIDSIIKIVMSFIKEFIYNSKKKQLDEEIEKIEEENDEIYAEADAAYVDFITEYERLRKANLRNSIREVQEDGSIAEKSTGQPKEDDK